ncbi:30S ribosome-binding factor RbfA [Nakamurella endophytica]|uniref:Ribosome-binding factor A n=1 Tax=Nakamurella endophytica TaxID=1748367 RepID=A0A917STI0_9ACTN|nr:30S ribosome-binding factor RbfA [Nakamurella endophytica]GGL95483.1 ribosome-binding factor A [Nakamurella endophytica]
MADAPRARRLAKRIAEIVATELEHQVKDPRLAMATITAATLTPDLREAVVYYTVYGGEEEQQATAAALASATGVLRTAVGRQTGVRYTPSLTFRADAVPEHAQHIEELLAAARASDAAVAEQAAGASYAGEADPYRTPRTDLDDDESDGESDEDDVTDAHADADEPFDEDDADPARARTGAIASAAPAQQHGVPAR